MSKFCPTCKILKEDNMFYKCKWRKDGLRGQCKECESKAVKKYSETHREKRNAKTKEWHKNNSEQSKSVSRQWKIDHEKENEFTAKKWRDKNKLHLQEYRKIYREQNIEKSREQCRIWFRKHPNKNRGYVHIRNARKKNISHTFTTNDWQECLKFFDNKDAYTGLPMKAVSQDHVIPLINGGEYSKQNIVPCEKVVNSSKNKNNMEEWYRKQPYYNQERLNKIHKWVEINTV